MAGRLVAAHGGKFAAVYDINDDVLESENIQPLFEVPCQVETTNEYKQVFLAKVR